jgi:hypothetical protein
MDILIKKDLTREILESIFITALEGGSNYWYLIEKEQLIKVREVVPDRTIPISQALFEAVYDHGVEVDINDLEQGDDEGDEEVLGTISMKTMQERIQKHVDNGAIAWAVADECNENGDASSSDVIFQVIVMDEVTFG